MKRRIAVVVVACASLVTAGLASADVLTGTAGSDTLRGTPSPDILLGREGNDRLIGGAGNDLLSGGRGLDTFVCGPGLDAVVADRADTLDPSCELVATATGLRSSQPTPGTTTEGTTTEGTTTEGTTTEGTTTEEEEPVGEEPESESGTDDDLDLDAILAWLFPDDGDPDWTEGVVFFLLGVMGALVTTYLFLGEFLPSMGGKADYDLDRWDLKRKKDERDKLNEERKQLAGSSPVPEDRMAALGSMVDDRTAEIDEIQKRLVSERWRLLTVGVTIYVLLGGAFATVFATSMAQALIIGFGWVAVADRLGLKREKETKDDLRQKDITKLEKDAEGHRQELKKAKDEQAELSRALGASREEAEQADMLVKELETATEELSGVKAELAMYKDKSRQMSGQVQGAATSEPTTTP